MLARNLVMLGLFITGILVGAWLWPLIMVHFGIAMDLTVSLIDLAQLSATFALALYIPFAIERYRERSKFSQTTLMDDVRSFERQVAQLNAIATDCTHRSVTAMHDVMRIRTGFLSANVKLGRLEKRIKKQCGRGGKFPLEEFRKSYENYWRVMTGGNLYSGGVIDWDLWRQQEFAFIEFEQAARSLLLYLSDNA